MLTSKIIHKTNCFSSQYLISPNISAAVQSAIISDMVQNLNMSQGFSTSVLLHYKYVLAWVGLCL